MEQFPIIKDQVFVFGSNVAGHHGAGAAAQALLHHGAKLGQGVGYAVNDMGSSFAIPTKDERIMTLPLEAIECFVWYFILFAQQHPEMVFNVTRIGCGLAGYKDQDIAPMFHEAPDNCNLPDGWRNFLNV